VSKTEMTETGFMGRITAAATHDMKNVLAIIKESAGLMEDLLALQQGTPLPQQERLSRVAANIKQQVQRGVDLATRLNTFAHSPDEAVAGVDLNVVTEQVVCMSGRFARLKNISVKALTHNRPIILVTDPLKIQMLMFQCIDLLLNCLQAGTTIVVQPVQRTDGAITLEFSSEQPGQNETKESVNLVSLPAWSGLEGVAQSLNGRVEACLAPVWLTVAFKSS